VQLDLDFRDMDLSTGAIDANAAARIRNILRGADLPICCISGYTNVVHPDPAIRKVNLRRYSSDKNRTCGFFTTSGWIEGGRQ
jgi:sugar phosphate isomerase/epimerase